MEYCGTPEPPVLRYSSRGPRTRWCSVGMLFLRCSASEGGGTAQYASRLIGEREVVRVTRSQSRSSGPTFGSGHDTKGHSEQTTTELAVMAAEIEQLPDRTGFLKFASQPGWMRVGFPVYQIGKTAASFVPIAAAAGNPP